MKLKDCLELGLACGLETVGECFDNVSIHAPSLFKYEDMAMELQEIVDHMTLFDVHSGHTIGSARWRLAEYGIVIIDIDVLMEKLASTEHEQWADWAQNIMETETISQGRVDRWKQLIGTPYSELSEEMKDLDRREVELRVFPVLKSLGII